MSYDLYLKPKTGQFSEDQFNRYFSNRDHYHVQNRQAGYGNENTGVYFSFELQDGTDLDEGEEFYPIAFNMNYFRPSYFVNEAEPEVRALVEAFSLSVDDPQANGMGTGDYSSEKFYSGWMHGNEFGYSAILREHPDVSTLPQQQLYDT